MHYRQTRGDTSWFVHDRFGLFIHWGLYALPARHEWVKQREEMTDEHYEGYLRRFNPDLYDPELWARTAAEAGMKYVVVTAKHHEGFCLWNSKLTDYQAANTPAGRDLLRPMLEAFRRRDMRIGLYYSLIDWHHPDFAIDDLHVLRNHPRRNELNQSRDQSKYVAYLHGQVRELLTEFGRIDLVFFDYSYRRPHDPNWVGKGREDWRSEELLRMVRRLQPKIVVNDRLDLLDVEDGWDYRTPEQYQPTQCPTVNGRPVVWEACHTLSGSWGYHREEDTFKTVDQLVRMLVDVVSKGGNLILNVGPTGRGEFDDRAMSRLAGIGEWMKRHGRSIYGCTQAPDEFVAPRDCRYTYNPATDRMYLHIFAWPYRTLDLPRMKGRVRYAQFLHDASEVKVFDSLPEYHQLEPRDPETIALQLPLRQPDAVVPVIELFLK